MLQSSWTTLPPGSHTIATIHPFRYFQAENKNDNTCLILIFPHPIQRSHAMTSISPTVFSFSKSVIFGSLAGAAPMLILTTLLAAGMLTEGRDHLLSSLWFAALPLMVSFPVVLTASVVFGIPLTVILRRLGRESIEAYMGAGATIGSTIPFAALLIMHAPSGYWLSFLGAISGAVTGRTWWISVREPRTRLS